MIHITEVASQKAAREIARVMAERGGEWLVNAVEDEGFVMALIGSPHGQRLLRSGSPHLAGPFSAKWKVAIIAMDLMEAKGNDGRESAGRGKDTAKRLRRGQESNAITAEVFMAMPATTAEIVQRVGIDRGVAKRAIRKLVILGQARRGRRIMTHRAGGCAYVYERAA